MNQSLLFQTQFPAGEPKTFTNQAASRQHALWSSELSGLGPSESEPVAKITSTDSTSLALVLGPGS